MENEQTSGAGDFVAWARQKLGLPADTAKEAVLEALEQRIGAATKSPATDSTSTLKRLSSEPRVIDLSTLDSLDERGARNRDSAERLLLEHDGWTVKTKKNGTVKRDASGRPKLVRRTARSKE
jgi:hypothetical protein